MRAVLLGTFHFSWSLIPICIDAFFQLVNLFVSFCAKCHVVSYHETLFGSLLAISRVDIRLGDSMLFGSSLALCSFLFFVLRHIFHHIFCHLLWYVVQWIQKLVSLAHPKIVCSLFVQFVVVNLSPSTIDHCRLYHAPFVHSL